jgi:cobalt-zinc-cadmium resistance protein CzcA
MTKPIYRALVLAMTMFLAVPGSHAQSGRLTLQDCIDKALKQNLRIKTDSLKVAREEALKKTAFDPAKTDFSLSQDPTSGGNNDNALSVTQSFSWPGVYVRRGKVLEQQVLVAARGKAVTAAEVVAQVKLSYYGYLYQVEKLKVIRFLDSLYQDFSRKASLRAGVGETGSLEQLSARNKLKETEVLEKQMQAELDQYALKLQELVNSPVTVIPTGTSFGAISWERENDSSHAGRNPGLDYSRQQVQLAQARLQLEKAKLWPDITIGYSRQLLIGGFNPAHIEREYFPGTRTGGFQVGMSLPLLAGGRVGRIKSEKINEELAYNEWEAERQRLETAWQQALKTYQKYALSLSYYHDSGLKLAEEQIRVARLSFAKGEIGYVEFIQNISQAAETKLNYLSVVNQLNQSTIHLQYLQGDLR